MSVAALARRLRNRLRPTVRPRGTAVTLQTDRPNTADEWEREYLAPVEPVHGLASPIARIVADRTSDGEMLLETGCGSGTLSAELAAAGRHVVLLDFSARILERAAAVFHASGLEAPRTIQHDLLTPPIPLPDASVDWVWSSGVLEHWTDEELGPVLSDMARVARRGVLSLVPSARSVLYRWGKAVAEANGTWPYGREIPRVSLAPLFERHGLSVVEERDCLHDVTPEFLSMVGLPGVLESGRAWWSSLAEDDPARDGQGYLVLTVGVKRAGAAS